MTYWRTMLLLRFSVELPVVPSVCPVIYTKRTFGYSLSSWVIMDRYCWTSVVLSEDISPHHDHIKAFACGAWSSMLLAVARKVPAFQLKLLLLPIRSKIGFAWSGGTIDCLRKLKVGGVT